MTVSLTSGTAAMSFWKSPCAFIDLSSLTPWMRRFFCQKSPWATTRRSSSTFLLLSGWTCCRFSRTSAWVQQGSPSSFLGFGGDGAAQEAIEWNNQLTTVCVGRLISVSSSFSLPSEGLLLQKKMRGLPLFNKNERWSSIGACWNMHQRSRLWKWTKKFKFSHFYSIGQPEQHLFPTEGEFPKMIDSQPAESLFSEENNSVVPKKIKHLFLASSFDKAMKNMTWPLRNGGIIPWGSNKQVCFF